MREPGLLHFATKHSASAQCDTKIKVGREEIRMDSQDDELLRHDHTELGELLDQLIVMFDANDITQTYATLDLFWARLAMHIRAEHLHLFPAILQAVTQTASARQNNDTRNRDEPSPAEAESTIEQLRYDHDFFMRELAQAVAVMRDLLNNAHTASPHTASPHTASPHTASHEQLQNVRKTIEAVQQRLIKHNEIEENGIYVWTTTLLSETEQADLAALMNKELQNMPHRFSTKPNETSER